MISQKRTPCSLTSIPSPPPLSPLAHLDLPSSSLLCSAKVHTYLSTWTTATRSSSLRASSSSSLPHPPPRPPHLNTPSGTAAMVILPRATPTPLPRPPPLLRQPPCQCRRRRRHPPLQVPQNQRHHPRLIPTHQRPLLKNAQRLRPRLRPRPRPRPPLVRIVPHPLRLINLHRSRSLRHPQRRTTGPPVV